MIWKVVAEVALGIIVDIIDVKSDISADIKVICSIMGVLCIVSIALI